MHYIYWKDTMTYTSYNNDYNIDLSPEEQWIKVKNAKDEIILVAPATSIVRIEIDDE